jgi:Asp-tRNA(Asn)/Glu-tRNA(Gln) amidotransferase A subunit family amidase
MKPIHSRSLAELLPDLRSARVTVRECAEALLARIDATDAAIGAWACLDRDHALREAARLDAVAPSARGPLFGAPLGLKDIIHTTSLPTRMGSRAFDGFAPARDASCVTRLVDAGGYAFGKTVTTELAFLHPGKTRNPWNPGHTPGGSSQGSAAAVAAGHVPAALGTQTNGSVIRPAAFCGVVGFKPTLGVIAFDGVGLFSQTLDTIGTFTRTVADAALVAGPLSAGAIAREPAAVARPPRFAYLPGFPWTTVGGDAEAALDAAAVRLRDAGAEVVAVALPDALGEVARMHRTIMLHEAAANLGGLQDRVRAQLSAALNAALDEGRSIDAEAYARALAGRAVTIAAATDWLSRYDALIAPPTTGSAPAGLDSTGDPSCCTLASLLGAPAITLPIARDARGLPLGMQLMAPPGDDARLLAVASWCERQLPFAGLV